MAKGLDYYDALGLTRSADDIAIRRAYRRLALQFHPDMNKEEGAATEFNRVCEAYDILSDAKRKGTYDLYGEEGLKDGVTDSQGGLKGGLYTFDPEVTPNLVFTRFFGCSNPYQALDAISAQFEALSTTEAPKLGKSKVHLVELTLEEIFHGCLKKVTHKRKVLLESGEYIEEPRSLVIDVKPGLPSGTRFVFEGEGNKTFKKDPGPVVFVLKPLPHPLFQRRGVDLVHKVVLPLYQALSGTSIDIPTLDNRKLSVPVADMVKPGYSTVVIGEGMPKPGLPGSKGNLIIEVELLFPTGLSEVQKMLIKAAFFLPSGHASNEVQSRALREFEAVFKNPQFGWAGLIPK